MGGDHRPRGESGRRAAHLGRALLRHREPGHLARHGLRGGRRARADPHQPPRRAAGTREGPRDLPQPRGGRGGPRLPGPRARLRLLSLRPQAAALHAARGAAPRPRCGARGRRAARDRQRRRREAFDPGRHPRAPRPRRPELRARRVQRLQHLLLPGRVELLGRLVGLARGRQARPRDRAERRRQPRQRVELLPAARSAGRGVAAYPGRPAGDARDPAGRLPPEALLRPRAPGAARGNRGARTPRAARQPWACWW